MRKLKLLFAAFVLTASSGFAQETLDITDLYITNPGFELGNTDGWTVGASSDTGARSTTNDTYKMSNSEGSYLFNTWWKGIPITQTIQSLPAGSYTLTSVVASDGATVYMISGDNSDEYVYTETTDAKVGIQLTKNFTLSEATNYKIGAVGGGDGEAGVHKAYQEDGYWWYKVDNFRLVLNLEGGATIPAAIVTKLLASTPTGTMSTTVKNEMDDAIDAFEANATLSNYDAVLAAMAKARTSIASYSTIASGTVPTNSVAGWAISTTNGGLACNTWSTEGNTDGSGMTTDFIQDHVGSGTALAGGNAGGKLYYTFNDLNPGETYVVTARVRVFNESGTGVTGASYFVGANSKSLETFGAACTGDYATKGRFAVLSCAGTVDSDGKLQFGVELDAASPINWIAIKDVTIAAGTGDVPTAIELNKPTVELTTGGFETLTASITPSTSDDKTVLWSSSDETVATVSGGNIVALKAGTATITATAYAGTDVKATCTVTVTDASAPSNYSTTIAAGDYYIMNAATGTFLGGGNSWGTQASVIEHGIPFTVALGDGVYTLDSHTYNDADKHFLNGTYVDGASTNLYITSVGEGKFTISTGETSGYEAVLPGSTVVSNTGSADNKLAQWYFLSKNDRDKMLAAATSENPADATYYIKEANISRNLRVAYNTSGWTNIAYGDDKNQTNDNFNAQVWNGSVDVYQTIENIPNGTYTLNMQGFSSGSGVKLYANDVKVDVLPQPGITKQADAAPHFAAKEYTNTLTVIVTDRTLKIGLEGDCTSAKWLCYDNFELFMTAYTANTGVTASIANEGKIQIGSTSAITAATVPATASFNALTYTSADEDIATVDENGVVTGVALGSTTITVTANEMEDFSETIDVEVILTHPTAITLNETEVALNAETTTATLSVASTTPDGANTQVTWASSDEDVATVNEAGVVTAVSSGTATITATSAVESTVKATATVTVTFPETTVASYVNDGATRTVRHWGANLIKNGSFEYPNPVYGWTTGDGAANTNRPAMVASNFNVISTGAADGSKYLQGKSNSGQNATSSIYTAWPIENGKKYVFGYKIKADKAETTNGYIGTSLSATVAEGTKLTPNPTYGTDWTDIQYEFTNSDNKAYLVFSARWLGDNKSFDNFYLCEILADDETVGNVDYATAAIPTDNIGTGAFQYSQDAIDAANALVQGTASVADVEAAYEAVTTLNVPAATQAYNIVFNCEGHSATGNALTLIPNPAQTQGLYGLKYLAPANVNLAQAFYFTHTTGNKYKIHAIDADDYKRYITTQAEGYGTTWYEGIRTIDDATKAMEVEIRPNGEGLYLMWNVGANKPLGHNGINNNDLFTNNTANFQFAETTQAAITINTKAAGWGTLMVPFAMSIPSGGKAYTCNAAEGNTLTLVEVEGDLQPNTPYIIEGAWDCIVSGDAHGTELTYTNGLLTGVYVDTQVPVGKFVLQKKSTTVGFYKVAEGKQPTASANRAYLTAPTADARFDAFFFGNETTGINAINALLSGKAEIYNLKGEKIDRLQKGMNIIKTNGKIQKVMVK